MPEEHALREPVADPRQVGVAGRRLDARWVGTAARLVIGGVYAVSGFTKVVDIDGTIRSVRAYRLLPEAIVPSVGAGLPVLELALSALLLTGLLTRVAAAVTFPLSLAFFFGVSWAWAKGLQIECGCFGNGGFNADPVPGYVRELVLNSVMMLAAAWLVRWPATFFSLDGGLGLTAVPTSEIETDPDLEDDVSGGPRTGAQQ